MLKTSEQAWLWNHKCGSLELYFMNGRELKLDPSFSAVQTLLQFQSGIHSGSDSQLPEAMDFPGRRG